MNRNNQSDSKRNLAAAVPTPAEVHERIETNRRERLFLRRLLKLAIDAERVASPPKNKTTGTA